MMSHNRVNSTLKTTNLLKKDENGADALSSVKAGAMLWENLGLKRSSIAASLRAVWSSEQNEHIHAKILPCRTHTNLNELEPEVTEQISAWLTTISDKDYKIVWNGGHFRKLKIKQIFYIFRKTVQIMFQVEYKINNYNFLKNNLISKKFLISLELEQIP